MILLSFFISRVNMTSSFKQTKLELKLLTDTAMSLITEKDIRGRICHGTHRLSRLQ